MRQHLVPVYHGVHIEVGFRAGLPSAASLTMLANKRLGLLINSRVALIKDGITRVANGLADQSSLRLCGFA
jgi:hypothetical protein